MLVRGELTEGHARAVLAVPDNAERIRLAKRIVSGGLSVRAAERAAQGAGAKRKRRRATASVDPALASRVETAATRATGMAARVRTAGSRFRSPTRPSSRSSPRRSSD